MASDKAAEKPGSDTPSSATVSAEEASAKKPTAALEEDDEFEDFPVDGTASSHNLRPPK